jgi:hypothetical protein
MVVGANLQKDNKKKKLVNLWNFSLKLFYKFNKGLIEDVKRKLLARINPFILD